MRHMRDLHDRGPHDDHEEAGQEEHDHRHGELGGKRGGLLLGIGEALLAVLLGCDAQRLAERRAVFFGLVQRGRDRLDAGMAAALGEVLEGDAALGKIGKLGRRQRQLLGELGRLLADLGGDAGEGGLDRHARSTQISIRSSASGKARMIDCWRREIALETKTSGR